MEVKHPRGARRSLPVRQAFIVPLLLFAPSITFADITAIDNPRIDRGRDAVSATFAISDSSGLRVISLTDPDLSFLRNAAVFLVEDRRSIASFGDASFPGRLSLSGASSLGVALMPSYPGYDYSTLSEAASAAAEEREPVPIPRSDLEKSLALASYSLRGSYSLAFRAPGGLAVGLTAENELSLRLAYNFFDLAPSIDYLKEGRSIAQAFSKYYSGTAFSRIKDEASASLGLDFGEGRILKADAAIVVTDLLYEDHSLGLSYSWRAGMELGASYSSASYETYNGIRPDRLSLAFAALVAGSARLEAEAFLRSPLSREADIGLRLTLSLARPAARDGSAGASAAFRASGSSASAGASAGAGASAIDPSLFAGGAESGGEARKLRERRDGAIDRDIHSILDIRDRSFGEVVDLLYTYRKSLYRYDYERAVDFLAGDRLAGSDPRSFLDSGGVCVDAARFIATVLRNNSVRVRTALVQRLDGSAHCFVVAEDSDGSYYAVDGFARATRFAAASSFSSAAAAYGGGFSQLVTRDPEGRVDAVLASPDIEALDAVLGY